MGEIVGSAVKEGTIRWDVVRLVAVNAILFFMFGWGFKGCSAQPTQAKPTMVTFDVGKDRGAKIHYKGESYYALLVSGKDDWVDSDGKVLIRESQLGALWGADQEELNTVYWGIVRQRRAAKLIKAGSKYR